MLADYYHRFVGFPDVSGGKEAACMQETPVQYLSQEDLLEKGMAYPLQYSCLGNSVDRGARQGYSPWSCQESDTTKRLKLDRVPGATLSA